MRQVEIVMLEGGQSFVEEDGELVSDSEYADKYVSLKTPFGTVLVALSNDDAGGWVLRLDIPEDVDFTTHEHQWSGGGDG